MTQTVLGSIVSLWRYPVKSMLGEELNATEVTKRGLLGDRAYALVDGTDGKVASAKNPRKWPQLFDCRAALTDIPRTGVKAPPVRITLPDGTIINSEQPDLNQIFSKMLKREVSLSALPDVRTATSARIAWMDHPHWNVYYRSSTDGGSTWSGETVLSSFVAGYSYIFADGFRFPFGDYFDMDIDNQSHTQTAWGEGYKRSRVASGLLACMLSPLPGRIDGACSLALLHRRRPSLIT